MYQLPPNPNEGDILRLLQDAVTESPVLDYKAEMYAPNDEGRRELLRDIVAFANAGGGHIVLGIEEQDLVPTNVVGVPSAHDEREKIIASVRSAVDPRILGFDVQVVDISGKNPVVVIAVPRSRHGPHMVTFKELYQFWKRAGTSKHRMSALEIREHCMSTEMLRMRMEEFLEKHWQQALTYAQSKPGQYFSVTPLLLDEQSVDVFNPQFNNEMYRVLLPEELVTSHSGNARPSLYGIEAQDDSGRGLLRLFRNGHLDYMCTLDPEIDFITDKATVNGTPETLNSLFGGRWCTFPGRLLKVIKAIHEKSNLVAPMIVQSGVLSAIGLKMRPPNDQVWSFRGIPSYRGPEPHIRCQMQFNHDWEPNTVNKQVADRLWNAFGSRECPFLKSP